MTSSNDLNVSSHQISIIDRERNRLRALMDGYLNEIKVARTNNHSRAERRKIKDFFFYGPAINWAALKVLRKIDSLEGITDLAQRVDARKANGTVCCLNIPKRNGSSRPIVILPDQMKVAQYLIKEILEKGQCADLGDHNFAKKGGGVSQAIREIRTALNQGYVYGMRADIRDCFASVNTQYLHEAFRLPRAVIDNNLMCENMHIVYRDLLDDHCDPVIALSDDCNTRRDLSGLLPGAPTSNLILGWLFKDLPHVLPENVRIFLYVDDIVLLAASEEEGRMAYIALEEYFLRHRGGRFVLHQEQPINFTQYAEFDFLGYSFHFGPSCGVEVEVSQENIQKLYCRLNKIEEISRTPDYQKLEKSLEIIKQFFYSFHQSDDKEIMRETLTHSAFESYLNT